MIVSEECYQLAGTLFASWALIDAARRYASVEEKEKALQATVNARAAVYDAEKEGAMTESEATKLNDDLNEVVHAIEWREFAEGRDRLEALSEQVFMISLEKVVECECGEKKPPDGIHEEERGNGH